MEVLFEYRGSRRQLTIASGDSVTECLTRELRLVGRSGARVVTADTDLSNDREGGCVYLLQRWSPQWDCYVDVSNANDIKDGDKLAVVAKPTPPSKFLLLCCWCCFGSSDASSNVKGVPRKKQKGVRKNEEIQALDYKFAVESETNSVWESQSLTPSVSRDNGEANCEEEKQYVRAPNGRASWKLLPITSSNDDLTAGEGEDVEGDAGEGKGVEGDAGEGEGVEGDAGEGEGVEGDAGEGEGVEGGGVEGDIGEQGENGERDGDSGEGNGVQGDGGEGENVQAEKVEDDAVRDDGVQGDAGEGDSVQGDANVPAGSGSVNGEDDNNTDSNTQESNTIEDQPPSDDTANNDDSIQQDNTNPKQNSEQVLDKETNNHD